MTDPTTQPSASTMEFETTAEDRQSWKIRADDAGRLARDIDLIIRQRDEHNEETKALLDLLKIRTDSIVALSTEREQLIHQRDEERKRADHWREEAGKWADMFGRVQAETSEDRYLEEYATVDRVWKALGITDYAGANGKEISVIVAELKAAHTEAVNETVAEIVEMMRTARTAITTPWQESDFLARWMDKIARRDFHKKTGEAGE